MTPVVSILISCYNAEKYVAAAIESALNQSWPNKEIIVVNDGSTDASGKVIEQFRIKGLKIIHQENKGQSSAANRAFRESTGEFIKFFDADDLIAPKTVELQMSRLNRDATAIASAEWGRFYADDISTFVLNRQSVWRDMDPLEWLVEAFMDARPMMQCALFLIPRKILDRAGGWDEQLTLINDFEFFTRVICHCSKVYFTPEARVYYRSGISGSVSGRKNRVAVESAFESIVKGTSYILARRQDGRAKLACANVFQDFVYTFYPGHRDLRLKMEAKIRELGGSNLAASGSPAFEKLSKVLGWRLARRAQFLAAGIR